MSKKSKKKKKNIKQQQKQQSIRRTNFCMVSMSSTPLLLRTFLVIGRGLKYLGIFILAMFVAAMVIASGGFLFSDGLKPFLIFWKDFFTFWKGENLLFLFILFGPFVLWYVSARWIKKHYKERYFKAYEDKVVIKSKDGKAISLNYEKLGLSIRTRKIKIGPEWMEIPYDTDIRHVSPEWSESPLREEKIRLYSLGKRDTGELLALLSQKCGTPYETRKMEENIEEYTAGWIMTYFIGWPILLISVYVCGWIYTLEEYKSLWEFVKAVPRENTWVLVVGLIGVFLILMGYWIKLLFFWRLRSYFKPYKDYFHISW